MTREESENPRWSCDPKLVNSDSVISCSGRLVTTCIRRSSCVRRSHTQAGHEPNHLDLVSYRCYRPVTFRPYDSDSEVSTKERTSKPASSTPHMRNSHRSTGVISPLRFSLNVVAKKSPFLSATNSQFFVRKDNTLKGPKFVRITVLACRTL